MRTSEVELALFKRVEVGKRVVDQVGRETHVGQSRWCVRGDMRGANSCRRSSSKKDVVRVVV
jgi:hypothetical protein